MKKSKNKHMSYAKFRKIWLEFGFEFECSKALSSALIKMANGDRSDFDRIERKLAEIDAQK